MTRYGIIDFSSTSVSLLIADVEEENIVPIFKDRKTISVLDYIEKNGKFSPRGTQKVIDALKTLISNAGAAKVEKIYTIATAAMREIKNYEEVGKAIEDETGLKISVIDGKTEAYADYVANARFTLLSSAALIDIGGASTEVCDFAKTNKKEMISVPIGAVSIQKQCIAEIYPSAKEADKITDIAEKEFDKGKVPTKGRFETAILVGANCNALYSIYADYFNIDPSKEKEIKLKKLKKLTKFLISSPQRSMLIIKNAPEKVHVIIPTALLVKNLLKRFEIKSAVISELGVKEGYLKLIVTGKVEAVPLVLEKEN
jgi:Exopolyphosphatase